jgi:hypothetical protein
LIIDLQRRIHEAGRIRIGQQITSSNGKTRPAKLDTFRLTSPDRRRIADAAKLYGGTPKEWAAPAGRQYELITEVDTLPVVVPPADMCFSQNYELWSAGGCVRRCDGHTESLSDGQCLCDPDKRDCAIHTRLSVMLKDLAGLGVWRIDTSGYYAAVELQGAVEVVRLAAGHGQMLPAVLRLEQRMVKRGGQTRRFAVPVLDIDISPAQLLGGQRDPLDTGTIAIEPPPPPAGPLTPVPDTVPERPTASIAEQALTPPTRRKGSQQPIPATRLKPRTAAQAAAMQTVATLNNPTPQQPAGDEPADEPDPDQLGLPLDQPMITSPQLKKLSILLEEQGFTDSASARGFISAAIGREIPTRKDLTKDEASKAIDILENAQETTDGDI